MATYYLVIEVPGPEWDPSRPRRQHDGWDEHATYVDGLAHEGVVVLGGPLDDPDYGPALLVFTSADEDEVRKRLADDPWMDAILTIESVQPWTIWVGTLPG